MVQGFENITNELSAEELVVVPYMVKAFGNYKKANPIKSAELILKMNAWMKKYGLTWTMTDVKLRKIVNYIRVQSIAPICANSDGYFIATTEEELQIQIDSLRQRANSILSCANGLAKISKPQKV